MTDYMLANALQQCLLHALTQLLQLLTGTSWLDQALSETRSEAQSLPRMAPTPPSIPSLQSGQPPPVLSWQTGPAGAQPLQAMSARTGLPFAQPQSSLRSTRTASIPAGIPLQPWIDMALVLNASGDDLVFIPPVADFVRHFDNMLRDLPNTIVVVQRMVTHPDLEVAYLLHDPRLGLPVGNTHCSLAGVVTDQL